MLKVIQVNNDFKNSNTIKFMCCLSVIFTENALEKLENEDDFFKGLRIQINYSQSEI